MAGVGGGSRALIGFGRRVVAGAAPTRHMRFYCVKTDDAARAQERKQGAVNVACLLGGVVAAYLFNEWAVGAELDELRKELERQQ